MSEKKHELLLIVAALLVFTSLLLYSVIDSPVHSNLEAVAVTEHTFRAPATTVAFSGKVNINTADISELIQLDGVGESKARAIIEYREKNGRFRTPDEITNVEGIGTGILNNNIDKITV